MNDKRLSALPKATSMLPQAKPTARYSAPAILDLGASKDFFKGYDGDGYDCYCCIRQSTASVLN